MRDRLTDLLKKIEDTPFPGMATKANLANQFTDYAINCIVDEMLKNGVIVTSCKVGDKVYKITRNKVKECEVTFVGISADERCSYFNFVENYEDGTFYKSYSMVFGVIGKSVFLTREEAEKALKGGGKHDQI